MNEMITCINCPVGCRMTVSLSDNGGLLSVEGNSCPRGAAYAKQECIQPMRTITAVLPVAGSSIPVSVKTSAPVPKSQISSIMRILGNLEITPPIRMGEIIVPDILSTGADIVATRAV